MRPVKIGINALFRGEPTGVANYIIKLVKYLARLDKENQYTIFVTETNRHYFNLRQDNFHEIVCQVNTGNPIIRRVWEQTSFPKLLKACELDIIHCPTNIIPILSPCKSIVTLLDCQYFHESPKNTFLRKNFNKIFMRLSLKKADATITISESMKENILKYLGSNRKSIHVIHLGQDYDDIFHHGINPDVIKQKIGIQGKYLLFVGYPSYRKNLAGLTRGFALALKKLREPCDLVICGDINTKDESDYLNVIRLIEELEIGKHVKFTGYLDDQYLSALIVGAEFLVFPSFYEGFGLPAIEAMICGTPVLVSDIPVMREIVADSGLYVNPYDYEDISKGILKLFSDENLRMKLSIEGRQRASRFTWEDTARKTLECYLLTAKGNNP